jgi:replication factor C subunit 1
MRLRASGDRHEIRQQYLPVLWARLIKNLETSGDEAIEEIIDLMDSYFLTKDDWDAILELGVGPQNEGTIKIPSTTKSLFTRKYNQASHPLPFMKAGGAVAPMKKAKEQPDLEEAIEESDDGEILVDPAAEEDEEELDLKKDKYVTAPKKKKKKAPTKKGDKKAKATNDDDDEDMGSDDDVPVGKGKAKKGTSTKAKSKR